ncbi:MAG: OmpA family protein [Bacteroidales bacterium]|nr:OmpA family protein [Bacteroidales bacterium]MCL2133813.1 OmpA family protein [Bacteroidales bacterium]
MKQFTQILTISLFLIWGTEGLLHAQDYSKHEFSIYAGGGLSSLNYSVTVGEQKQGFGGLVGLGYQFFFSPNWSINTGAEFALYNSKFNLNNLIIREEVSDIEGESFEFSSRVSSYEERQVGGFLQVPLLLQFQTGGKHQFYAAAGGKVGIPVIKSYKSAGASLQNAGYYSYESYTYTTQEFLGFGTFADRGSKGDLDLKPAFFASAETGVKWRLSPSMSLYTGAYLDYGLNNTVNEQSSPFVDYVGNLALNSIVHATYRDSRNDLNAYAGKLRPLAAGIKLRLAFGASGKTAGAETKHDSPPPYIPPPISTPPVIDTAEEEAARKAAENAEAERLAKEQERQRIAAEKAAAEKARQAEEAQYLASQQAIQQPIADYSLSQTALTDVQKQELDTKIALLQQYPDMEIFIYGHTCEIGGDAINEKIGLQRAEKTKAYLVSKGIAEKRITGIASKRDTEPLVPNTNEENRKKNRRVEVLVDGEK